MIKVLHAIDGRAWGGAERVVAMLASGLQKRGNSVSVWTSKRGGCAPIFREKLGEGVEIKELPLLNDADIVSIAHFWYALRKYDIVHLHLSHAAVLCAVALAISPNHYSRKVICHFHGLIANPKHYRAYTQGVCVSKTVEIYVREKMPWMRTWCVYNGIDIDKAVRSLPLLPSSGTTMRIGYLARMSEGKGHEDLIKAFAMLGKNRDVELILGGDGKLMSYLQNLVKEMNLVGRVRFLGFIDPKDAFSFWKSMDIACFPSYNEGFGLSVLEAMASWLPIVAYSNAALMEVAGQVGFFVPIGDINGLARFLDKLLCDHALRLKYGNLAFERAKNFTIDAMVDQIMAVYREILRGM